MTEPMDRDTLELIAISFLDDGMSWEQREAMRRILDSDAALRHQLAVATYWLDVLEPEHMACQARAAYLEQQLENAIKDRDAWNGEASSHLHALCEKQAEVNGLEQARDTAERNEHVAMRHIKRMIEEQQDVKRYRTIVGKEQP